MRGKFVAVLVAAATLMLMVGAPRADAAAAPRHDAARIVGVSALGARNTDMYSTNWSGYAVPAAAGQHITAVSGSWGIPLIRNLHAGQSSSWLGIGGLTSNDLIQVGTSANGRAAGAYAWFEVLPAFSTRIYGCSGDYGCNVATYDRMSASITNNGGDTWTMMMANMGQGGPTAKWYWARTVSYRSTLSSAEWIFEAPQSGYAVNAPLVGLVPVMTQTLPAWAPHAKFYGGTYRVDGVTTGVRPSMATRIFMTDPIGIVPEATPSDMAGDGHFFVCAYAFSCQN